MSNDQSFYGFREQSATSNFQSFALELVPGNKCQLKCKNCYKGSGPMPKADGDMPTEFVRNTLWQAKQAGFSEAVFIGGEPTTHRDLPVFVRYALEIGLTPIVVTNGIRLANAFYAAQLTLPGVTLVLHGPLPAQVQDEEVRLPGYTAKLMRAYQNVINKPGVTVVAEVVVVNEFVEHIAEMVHWCRANNVVPFVELNRRGDNGIHYANTTSPEEVFALFQQLRANDPSPPAVLLPPTYGQPCTMAITGLHVKNFGDGDFGGVFSCCAQHVRHGDLCQQTLVEILHDPGLEVFKNQDQWIFGPCQSCEHYSLCRGGCRGEATLAFGCPRASCSSCWHIPATVRNDASVMAPPTCAGCPLLGNSACNPRR